MYNVCTIMYTHIRSQASDWNCCVKRLFVCTTVHIPYSTYHVKTNPSQMTTKERERERERDLTNEIYADLLKLLDIIMVSCIH